jgi:hypothetical protein
MRILLFPLMALAISANAQISAKVDTSYIQATYLGDLGKVQMLMCKLSFDNGLSTKVLISPESNLKKGDCIVFYHDLDNPRHVVVDRKKWYCFLMNELKRK